MPIKLVHEDDCDTSLIGDFSALTVLEECYFCAKQTRFWSAMSNTPVCPTCSRKHHWTALPKRLETLHEAYVPIRKLNKRQIDLRERVDDLELEEQRLILAGDNGRSLDWVRQQLRVGHKQMEKEGIPVLRPVVLPGEVGQVMDSVNAAGQMLEVLSVN
ncbi:hypothetical protein [Pseudomonas putida]|uniref:Uncharacterized protein n=1 Tax=Pseudomonas putida TaxID=303 RepID=A0A8I1EDH8_PSEPU|nr:hypothetical protein [Pseudomonas putida]MBI6883264.1 hypothetical protein [Pseudomonas putida]